MVEISQYLDSLEDAWKIYLDDVIVKLQEEMKIIGNAEADLVKLSEEESYLKKAIAAQEGKGFAFRLFGRKSDDTDTLLKTKTPGLKNRLNEIKNQKQEVTESLNGKQLVKRAGEKWRKLQDRCTELENHHNELVKKLEDRHQKMTLLMRPVDAEADMEWKAILNDYRKTRAEKEQKTAELERHIALSGYITEGSGWEEAEQKVTR